jgi:hypothetical protein
MLYFLNILKKAHFSLELFECLKTKKFKQVKRRSSGRILIRPDQVNTIIKSKQP